MVDFLPANMVGNTENPWFSKKIAENGAFTGKLHDFRGFAGFQHFDISNGKLLLGLLLPNSAYKKCHLHKAAGGSRGSPPHFDGSDGKKHGKSTVFWETARKRSVLANCTIFAVLRVSSNFDISNEKLVLGFLLPNSAYKMCHSHKACRRKEKIDVSLVLNPKRSRSGWCAAS